MRADRLAASRTRLALVLASWLCNRCAGSPARPETPREHDRGWVHHQLRDAAYQLRGVLGAEGAEGLLRLRLRRDEYSEFFTPEGERRIAQLPMGLSPSPGERRWSLFARLQRSALVGYCARGAHRVAVGGEEGFGVEAYVIDRFLIVGREPDGVWGAWIEGLILTANGWRLMPTVPFDRQVETPRRDHTDVELWDCDVGVPPDARQVL